MEISNTTTRVIVSLIAIPLIVLASYLGSYYFFFFVLAIGLISYYEFSGMVKKNIANANLWFGLLAISFIIINQFHRIIDFIPLLFIVILLLLMIELFRNKGSVVKNLGVTILGILYIGLFSSALITIREYYPTVNDLYQKGGYVIISMLATIWICDSAAFFGGTALGKHKLFPRISPNKSWEGALFGFVFAIFTMLLAKLVVLDFLSWSNVVVLGIIIGIIGQLGDLVESSIKRDAGVKDSSSIIPGHGGIYDRFDSLLFSAPAVWLYLKYFS
ncbi:MAG: phosphatidate cytidylyltransferase [Ignavibacteriae bacterium]|nr:MAG: phosphatidate cytidylyltransferase [Ignavibacteriota bacterium]